MCIRDRFGAESIAFMSEARYFRTIYILSELWQQTGWGAVIFLAALSGVDQQLHEAAMIDGATRVQRIWHVNLPSILPTVTIMFILSVGNLFSVGYEKAYLMQNDLNLSVSEMTSTYVYKLGIVNSSFSFSTAVGLFNSVVNLVMLVVVNQAAKRISDVSVL